MTPAQTAYYQPLVNAWNAGGVPAGATGTTLVTTDTDAKKLAAVLSWAVAGPTNPVLVPAYRIYGAVVPAEFQALTAAQQQLVRDIWSQGTVDGSPGSNAASVLAQVFGAGTQTRANLVTLQNSFKTTVPWWQSVGMLWAPTINDAIQAGLVANPTNWTWSIVSKQRDGNNKNVVAQILFAQLDGAGNLTGIQFAETIGAVTLADSDVSNFAIKRIANAFLPGDAALAALTA